ncbi:MAG: low molecular weight phosphatase family protein [bacterium]|nr:low molecular weight phosphatase family protein [bacterium]
MNKPKTILFLCTGNYFRSRFAEYYFNYFAQDLPWKAESRGLALFTYNNVGPISSYTERELSRLGIPANNPRFPISAKEEDFEKADKIIALSKSEHEPMILKNFSKWKDQVIYWDIGDIDMMSLNDAFPMMEKRLRELIESLR